MAPSPATVPSPHPLRIAGWSIAAALLVAPAIAMHFTDEVDWTAGDFAFAAIMIGGFGLLVEWFVRQSADWCYRAAMLIALAVSFAILWSNAAVGIIGEPDHPANLAYIAVIALAALGTIAARLRAPGMARAMTAAALAQGACVGLAIAFDPVAAIPTLFFACGWAASALLFRAAKG